jgi:hypothetical protein
MKEIAGVLFCLLWAGGVVVAAGWWKLAAIVFPPYAFYLFVERLMMYWGMA